MEGFQLVLTILTVHVNNVMNGLVEAFGYIVATFIMGRYGRRPITSASLFFAGLGNLHQVHLCLHDCDKRIANKVRCIKRNCNFWNSNNKFKSFKFMFSIVLMYRIVLIRT